MIEPFSSLSNQEKGSNKHIVIEMMNRIDIQENKVKDVDLTNEESKYIDWGLNPFLNWVKFIGALQSSNGKIRENLMSLIYRNLAWFFTIASQSSLIFSVVYLNNIGYYLWHSDNKNGGYHTTFMWCMLINYTSKMIHSIGIHTMILFCLAQRFKDLVESLELTAIQLKWKNNQFDCATKLRKWSWIGVFYVLLSEGTLIGIETWEVETTGMQPTLARKFMEIYCCITKIYPTTAIVLFCLCSFAICQHLNGVKDQVESLSITNINEARKALSKLQQQHVQICNSVDHLNRCFGLILLIDIPYNFIGVINTSMVFLVNKSPIWSAYSILQMVSWVNHIANVILVSLTSQNISRQNQQLGSALYQMSNKIPELKLEIQSFTTQLTQLSPEVSAFGCFKVRKELIPTLVGTTLTYVLIMVQFYASE